MQNIFTMSYLGVLRDIRSGQVKMLLISTAMGVAALSCVAFLSNRFELGLQRDAAQMLGGDAVVTSSSKTPDIFSNKARSLGLNDSLTLSFSTMARRVQGEGRQQIETDSRSSTSRLVSLKAVDASYPLKGQLKVLNAQPVYETSGVKMPVEDTSHARDETRATADFVQTDPVPAKGVPGHGEVWVETSLLDAFELELGQSLMLGQATFRVTKILSFEPDKGSGFMSLAPRVLINQSDLERTQLMQPSSRINWRYAVSGSTEAVQAFNDFVKAQIESKSSFGVRLETLESGRPEIKQTLDRAIKFLRLVALLSVIISSVAVALAARNFSHQHLKECAMRRVLGQSQRSIAKVFVLEFLALGLVASLLGLMMGFVCHLFFVYMLSGLIDTVLPSPSWVPFFQGLGVGLCSMLAFGLPPVLQISNVAPLLMMRNEYGSPKAAPWVVWILGALGLVLLLGSMSQDTTLTIYVVGGFLAAILFFSGGAWAVIFGLRKVVNDQRAPTWLIIATRQIYARRAYSVLQISVLSVGLLALLLLVLVRTDLIQSWRNATPSDAPNRFVINIQTDQSDVFQAYLKASHIEQYDWYPMIKGRLIRINDEEVTANRYPDERAQRLVDREFNLSYSADVPTHNQIAQGRWITNQPNALSMEEGIAKTLHLQLGDHLKFDISGIEYEVTITSIRKVDWSSMRVNFFAMFPQAQMQDYPQSYISAFRAPNTKGFDNKLVDQFPNITTIDVGSTLNQVQSILEQVSRAVEFLFVFTLLSGLVVLVTCIHSTLEERAKEFAIIRALGARNRTIQHVQQAELCGMGALAGLMASLCAGAVGWGLSTYVFEFEWRVSPLFIAMGTLIGVCIAWGAGWMGMRSVMKQPVMTTLRGL
jgi:putative ABC transport system permease protein